MQIKQQDDPIRKRCKLAAKFFPWEQNVELCYFVKYIRMWEKQVLSFDAISFCLNTHLQIFPISTRWRSLKQGISVVCVQTKMSWHLMKEPLFLINACPRDRRTIKLKTISSARIFRYIRAPRAEIAFYHGEFMLLNYVTQSMFRADDYQLRI